MSKWCAAFDESSKETYYYNLDTQETQWELPEDAILCDDDGNPVVADVEDLQTESEHHSEAHDHVEPEAAVEDFCRVSWDE